MARCVWQREGKSVREGRELLKRGVEERSGKRCGGERSEGKGEEVDEGRRGMQSWSAVHTAPQVHVVYSCMCSLLIDRYSAPMGGFLVLAMEGACSQPYGGCPSSSLTQRPSVNLHGSSCGMIQLGMFAVFVTRYQSWNRHLQHLSLAAKHSEHCSIWVLQWDGFSLSHLSEETICILS